MPTTQTTATSLPSEATQLIRPPDLTPMERQFLDQAVHLERAARSRDARHATEVAQLKTEMVQLTTEITPLRTEVAKPRMQVASTDGAVSRLTMWLGALLDPVAPSGS